MKDYSPQRRRVHRGCFLIPLLRDLSASALKIVADPSFGGSAVQFPSPCSEIALAGLATQKPDYPILKTQTMTEYYAHDINNSRNDSAFARKNLYTNRTLRQ